MVAKVQLSILFLAMLAAERNRGSVTAAEPGSRAEGDDVRVTITTPKEAVRVNPRVYGLVCAEMITKGFLDDPEYVAAIAELRLKVFQYPGGSASYWHHPTGNGGLNARPEEVKKSAKGEASRWMQQTKGPDWFERYIGLLKKSQAESLFIANILNGTPDELDTFLQRLRKEKIGIAAVALGQEMHLSPGVVGLGLEEYRRRIIPYIKLMQDKYPGILVAVPATPVGRVTGKKQERLREWNQVLASSFAEWLSHLEECDWIEYGLVPGELTGLPEIKQRQHRAYYQALNPGISWGTTEPGIVTDPAT